MLLQRSKMNQKQKNEWEKKLHSYAKKGYRLVGMAHRKRMGEEKISAGLMDKPWYWLGFVVYQDNVRKGVKKVLAQAKRAGIGVKVITGDYQDTALEVMKQLGLKLHEGEVMTGSELEGIAEGELDNRISEIKLFARTSPTQKLKIVESLQRRGEVIAMTGDGVNDAPALKKADIGVVVSTASDVSKETADLVLLNDDFSTIIAAVEEGRGIFENLRKVILYLLSDSFSEVILVVGSLVLGLPLPITAAQILWVNLANDGLPNLALTVDPKADDLLKQKPRSVKDSIIDQEIKVLIALISITTGVLVLASFWWHLVQGYDINHARTFAFAMLGTDSLLYVFSSRSLKKPIWKDKIFSNIWLIGAVIMGFGIQLAAIYLPGMQKLLDTTPLTGGDWLRLIIMSLLVIVVIEVVKWAFIHKEDEI